MKEDDTEDEGGYLRLRRRKHAINKKDTYD
jgi:hypothetical protein